VATTTYAGTVAAKFQKPKFHNFKFSLALTYALFRFAELDLLNEKYLL
jgi:hypothetical protein